MIDPSLGCRAVGGWSSTCNTNVKIKMKSLCFFYFSPRLHFPLSWSTRETGTAAHCVFGAHNVLAHMVYLAHTVYWRTHRGFTKNVLGYNRSFTRCPQTFKNKVINSQNSSLRASRQTFKNKVINSQNSFSLRASPSGSCLSSGCIPGQVGLQG